MRHFINLILVIVILFTFSGCSKSKSFKELDHKDGLYLLKDNAKPFTGKVMEKYATGEDSIKARIKNGVLDGNYTSYYKTGTVKDSMVYKTDKLIRKKSWQENGSRLLIPRSSLEIDKDWRCYEIAPGGTKIPFSGLTVDSNYIEDNVKYVRLVEYLNGDKDGILERYFLNGKINLKIEYKNGKKNGKEIGYYENGKIGYFCWYKDNIPNGENISYFENGQIASKQRLENGKREGKAFYDFENGKVKCEETYLNGELEGIVVWYYENGQISSEGIYSKNKAEGKYVRYYENGTKKTEGNYLKDLRNGKYVWYYENGTKETEGNFLNDLRDGKWVWYRRDGSISSESEYKNGNFKMRCECCGRSYWSNEGWVPSVGYWRGFIADGRMEDGGKYCCKRCALVCGY